MEGLEASVISLSEVLHENGKLRIDSGYFEKVAIAAERKIEGLQNAKLGDITSTFRKGIFDIKADTYVDANEGVQFVRIGDLKGGLIRKTSTAWISHTAHEEEAKTALTFGDLILSKTAYPAAAFVNIGKCNASQDTIAVRLNAEGKRNFQAGYISSYLNSLHGHALMARRFQGNVQQHLSLEDGKALRVPLFSTAFQERVHQLVVVADKRFNDAENAQRKAEETLLEALGLADWVPPEPLSYSARLSDVVYAGRLDPEHFKGQYQEAQDQLARKGAVGFVSLGDLLSFLTNGHTPLRHNLSVGEIPFLAAEHVNDFSIDYISKKRILEEHHTGELQRTSLQTGDVLMTIKGRVGNAAVVEVNEPVANINQDVALLRFREDAPPIWYVLAYLNSRFGKLEVSKWATGQINPFLGLYNLKKVQVPRFSEEFELEIAHTTRARVKIALDAQTNARQVLEAAKCAVEIAIEGGEPAALAYLDTVEGAD